MSGKENSYYRTQSKEKFQNPCIAMCEMVSTSGAKKITRKMDPLEVGLAKFALVRLNSTKKFPLIRLFVGRGNFLFPG
jgi:hypothetical protein